jgi:nicotinamide-nucleotide amidase
VSAPSRDRDAADPRARDAVPPRAGYASSSRDRDVGIVATGDELVLGAHVDTNSAAIARAMQGLGLEPRRFVVLGDDEDALVHELLELAGRNVAIVLTGGLGPTLDDVTRHAVARAAGVDLVRDEQVLAHVRAIFESRGRPFAQANERQALFPQGAEVLPNPHGTAAGFCIEVGGALVFALPGPPREMLPMLEHEVLPRLAQLTGSGTAHERRSFYMLGLSESMFADMCGTWMGRAVNPLVGVTARHGVLSVSLRASCASREEAVRLADARAAEIRARFGEWIFSEQDPEPASALAALLVARKERLAIAESCTGGLVAEKLTRVPGISSVFDRGFVTYSNESKTELLGVEEELLRAHGAVSAQVASAMARGAAERSRATCAVSVTGIAGPDGGTAEKPVGLVWIGTFARGRVEAHERQFALRDRDLVREFAANAALDLLRRALGG